MVTDGIRPYKVGIWPRFVSPIIGFIGAALFMVFIVLAVSYGTSMRLAYVLAAAMGAFVCLLAWRQRCVGIWVSEQSVIIRSLLRTSRYERRVVLDVEVSSPQGRLNRGSKAPCLVLVDGKKCITFLSEASPLRLGGSSVSETVEAVRSLMAQ